MGTNCSLELGGSLGRECALTQEGHKGGWRREVLEPLLLLEAPDKVRLWKLSFHQNGRGVVYILNEPQTQHSPHNLATPLNRLRGWSQGWHLQAPNCPLQASPWPHWPLPNPPALASARPRRSSNTQSPALLQPSKNLGQKPPIHEACWDEIPPALHLQVQAGHWATALSWTPGLPMRSDSASIMLALDPGI